MVAEKSWSAATLLSNYSNPPTAPRLLLNEQSWEVQNRTLNTKTLWLGSPLDGMNPHDAGSENDKPPVGWSPNALTYGNFFCPRWIYDHTSTPWNYAPQQLTFQGPKSTAFWSPGRWHFPRRCLGGSSGGSLKWMSCSSCFQKDSWK